MMEAVRSERGDNQPACLCFGFGFPRTKPGGGKVENLGLVFQFSIRHHRGSCGNVGNSTAFGEFPKRLVVSVGSLPLAFHTFHSLGISIAQYH
jgi:hypothetical protein